MLFLKKKIVFVTLFNVISHVWCLVELPDVEDNDIGATETVIRDTVNNLFTTFKIKDVKQRPRLKQYSTIHNFFVSITLKDCDNLKEIAKLTRVNNIDNNTENFITQINELLNEGDKSNVQTDDIHVTTYIETFIAKLRQFKETYEYNQNLRNLSLNSDIVKILSDNEDNLKKFTNVDNATNIDENILDHDDVWQPSGRRVFQGHRTRVTFFPFMASVQFFEKFQCAGSIIRKDLVITAASCLQLAWNNRFFRENPAFLSIKIGCDYYSSGGEDIPVIDIHFHPDYYPKYLRNNLAVLRLKTHIMFSKKQGKVKRIELDKNASPLPINTNGITILGWGARSPNNIIYNPWYNRLSFAELEYYPIRECQDIYSRDYVSEKNFCAGFFSKGGGACNHDIGGPGITAGVLVGVISFGPPICGTPDAPTVFTKVGFYKKWIDTIMAQNLPEIVRLSTKLRPKTTFALHYSDLTRKRFKVTPVRKKEKEKTYEIPAIGRQNLKILQDDNLFKEFMATVFKSSELKSQQKSVEDIEEEHVETTTQRVHKQLVKPKHEAASISAQETASDEISTESERETKPLTTVKYSKTKKASLKNSDNSEELKLQDDIANLLDELDIYKLLNTNELINSDDEKVGRAREDAQSNHPKIEESSAVDDKITKENSKSGETGESDKSNMRETKNKKDYQSVEDKTDDEAVEITQEDDKMKMSGDDKENELDDKPFEADSESLQTEPDRGNGDDSDDINTEEDIDSVKAYKKQVNKDAQLDDLSYKSSSLEYRDTHKTKNRPKSEELESRLEETVTDEDDKPLRDRKVKKKLKSKRHKNKDKSEDVTSNEIMAEEYRDLHQVRSKKTKKSHKSKKDRKVKVQTTVHPADDKVRTDREGSDDEDGLSIEFQ